MKTNRITRRFAFVTALVTAATWAVMPDASAAACGGEPPSIAPGVSICSPGWVCMYQPSGDIYYYVSDYGCYNFTNIQGTFRWYNDQTGAAKVRMYNGYNGTGVEVVLMQPGAEFSINMTSIDSMRLTAS